MATKNMFNLKGEYGATAGFDDVSGYGKLMLDGVQQSGCGPSDADH